MILSRYIHWRVRSVEFLSLYNDMKTTITIQPSGFMMHYLDVLYSLYSKMSGFFAFMMKLIQPFTMNNHLWATYSLHDMFNLLFSTMKRL